MDFYSAGVEVILVLLLLTAVEARYFRIVRRMGFGWNFAQVASFAVVVNGLVQALRTLQHHRPTRFLGFGASWWVWWAIVLEGCVVTVLALGRGRDFDAIEPHPPTRLGMYVRERGTFIVMQAIALVLLVALFAIQGALGGWSLLVTAPIFFGYLVFAAWVTRGGATSPGQWPGWMTRFARPTARNTDKT